MLLTQIRAFSGDHGGYPPWDDGMATGRLSLVIIVAVFALQLLFAGLALWLHH
jgi:hypothetical protein